MTPHWVWLTFITILGANVGSFLNVVVYRLPAGISLVTPPSRCPYCEHELSMWRLENVPVLGWLWLRGKCRKCKAPISIQYPLVELTTAILFGGSYYLFYMLGGGTLDPAPYTNDWREPLGTPGYLFAQTWPIFLVWLVVIACLIAATLIDAKLYIIPLSITWVAGLVSVVVLPAAVFFGLPALGSGAQVFRYEPFVPIVGPTGAMVAWGGAVGLAIAFVLLKLGILPDSFEGEEEDILIEESMQESDGPSRPWIDYVMAWISPFGFVLGLTLAGILGWGEGMLPGHLHVLVVGALGYLAMRLVVLVWQMTRRKGEGDQPAQTEEEHDEIPPLLYPHRVALKELMYVGFPLLGMLVGHFIVSRDLITQPDPADSAWYYVLAGCVLGYLVGGGVIWAIRIFGTLAFRKEAMGLGDIHLLAAIGACLGWWETVFICFFLAPFLGILWVLMATDAASLLRKPTRHIPYGPFLAGGALLILILGIERADVADVLTPLIQAADPTFTNSLPFVP